MIESIPYALALVSAAGLAWDGWRRWLQQQRSQLEVVNKFQALARDFELHTVKTKDVCEKLAQSWNEELVKLKVQVNAQEMKTGFQRTR